MNPHTPHCKRLTACTPAHPFARWRSQASTPQRQLTVGSRALGAAFVLALATWAAMPANAVTWSGLGSDALWTNGDNWVGGSAPGAGVAATFDNTPTNKAVDIGTATIANNVTISAATSGYTFTGTGKLNGAFTYSSALANTFNCGIEPSNGNSTITQGTLNLGGYFNVGDSTYWNGTMTLNIKNGGSAKANRFHLESGSPTINVQAGGFLDCWAVLTLTSAQAGTGAIADVSGTLKSGQQYGYNPGLILQNDNNRLIIEGGGLVYVQGLGMNYSSGTTRSLSTVDMSGQGAGARLALKGGSAAVDTLPEFYALTGGTQKLDGQNFRYSADGSTWTKFDDMTGTDWFTLSQGTGTLAGYTVLQVLTPGEKKLLTFHWGSSTGVIDEGTHTVALQVPYGTVLNPLDPNPTYTVSVGATCDKTSDGSGIYNFTSPVTYTVTNGTSQDYTVTVTPALASSACNLLTFNWGGYYGLITEGTPNTVTLHVPSGTPLDTLNPTCTFSDFATVLPASGSAPDFLANNPINYVVKAEDNSTTKTYQVTVLADIPNVTLTIDNSTIAEAGGQAIVTASLSAATSRDVTVNLAFTGTATNPADYVPSATSISIPQGSTTGTITLTAEPDAVYEGPKTIVVDISTVVNGLELGSQTVTTSIIDDDPNTAADMLTFNWESYSAWINGLDVSLIVPPGTALATLIPTFMLSGGAGVLPLPGSTVDFSNSQTTPVDYSVTSEDGFTTKTYKVTVLHANLAPPALLAAGGGPSTIPGASAASIIAAIGKVPDDTYTGTVRLDWSQEFNAAFSNGGGISMATNAYDTYLGASNSSNWTLHKEGTALDNFAFKVGGVAVPIVLNVPKTFHMIINYVAGANDTATIVFDGVTQTLPSGGVANWSISNTNGLTYWMRSGNLDITGLTLYAPGAQSGYALWASTNAAGGEPGADFNNDGVSNGVAYFMGMDGLATHPGVVDGKVTWPHVNAVASFEVQVSDNLTDWVSANPLDITATFPGQVIFTLPTGATKTFCRLMVIP
ncbi:MAG: hypothetical protein NTW21_24375 [Verrucomicrobia bacterium]|nr:hypothetical protein [Verrucomicrobiota bacterium]